jgi:hypothetical protein
MSETRILIRLLRMYIPRNWKFGQAFSKLRNFGGGLNPPNTPLGTPVHHPMWVIKPGNLILLGFDAELLGKRFPAFQSHVVLSVVMEPNLP